MNFENVKTTIINDLKVRNKSCLKYIDNNSDNIKKCFQEKEQEQNNNLNSLQFVNELIEVVLHTEKKFDLIEKVLKHPIFTDLYQLFKNSEVLIKTCQNEHVKAVQWLLTMNINYKVQDKEGKTALMTASQFPSLAFAVTTILSADPESRTLKDKKKKSNINNNSNNWDINDRNKQGETVFIYCCKKEKFSTTGKFLLDQFPELDPNIVDDQSWNAAMYLAEKGKSPDLMVLYKSKRCHMEYQNKLHQSILSITLDRMYTPVTIQDGTTTKQKISPLYSSYLHTLNTLNIMGYNFNSPVDEAGTTAMMIFILMNDIGTLTALLKNNSIDLTQENEEGESAISLCFKCKNANYIYTLLKCHPSFSYDYKDPQNGNNLIMLAAMNATISTATLEEILRQSEERHGSGSLQAVNDKKENALILATKLRCKKNAFTLLKHDSSLHQQQDHLGNTALHYAIELQDKYLIKLLLSYQADIHQKNLQGKSPYDLVQENPDQIFSQKIYELFSNPGKTVGLPKSEDDAEENEEDISTRIPSSRLQQYTETKNYLKPRVNIHFQKDFEFNKSLDMIQQVTFNNDTYYSNKLYGLQASKSALFTPTFF